MRSKVVLLSGLFLVLILTAGLVQAETVEFDLKDLEEVARDEKVKLVLDIGDAELVFAPEKDNIYLSPGLKCKKWGSTIHIFSPEKKKYLGLFGKKDYYLVIGSKKEYKLLDISAGGLFITGEIKADEIDLKAGGISIEADIHSRIIDINGAGIKISGYLRGENLSVNGAGISLNLNVEGVENLNINGVGINSRIKYLDGWTGIRNLRFNGIGGNLDIYVPVDNNLETEGKLDISTNGLFSTEVHHY
ncbi:MAG TPA: hypothetical protein VKY40_04845 [Halanaerobiales bacterium]|nr:hypothetical protein [Halanaerobiales bacterium]